MQVAFINECKSYEISNQIFFQVDLNLLVVGNRRESIVLTWC